jgi:hypothetical protein
MYRAMNIITNESDLLSSIREVYSRRPESRFLEAWELQHLSALLRELSDRVLRRNYPEGWGIEHNTVDE